MARAKKENVFPDYVRVREVDQEHLAELIIQAKGDRSLNDFARQCNVEPSTLSRVVNQKLSGPCSDKLIQSISENAAPESGVTLDKLCDAFGLAKVSEYSTDFMDSMEQIKDTVRAITDIKIPVPSDSFKKIQKVLSNYSDVLERMMCSLGGKEVWKAYSKYMEEYSRAISNLTQQQKFMQSPEIVVKVNNHDLEKDVPQEVINQVSERMKPEDFEREAREIITAGLIEKGFAVKLDLSPDHLDQGEHYTFSVSTDALADRGMKQWLFEVKSGFYSTGIRSMEKIFQELYLHSLYDEGKAISLVLSDTNAFKGIKEKYLNQPVYDYISAILVDRANRKVADEFIFPQRGRGEYQSVFLENNGTADE